jgi:hypothetical protein
MSTTSQHEFHPDAESLSAFAEQALAERERGEVLAHLAVCGRCRQVVVLARESADAEMAASAVPRHAAVRPGAWWKGWRLALAPAAALAATAMFAFYVHTRDTERGAQMAKNERQAVAQNQLIPAPPSPQEQPKPASPAAAPAPKAPESTPSDKTFRPRLSPAAVTAPPPPAPEAPPAMSQLEMPRAQSAPAAGAQAGFGPARPDEGGPPADKSTPAVSEFNKEQRERQMQRQQAEAFEGRILSAKEKPPANDRDASGAPQANAASSATVINGQLEVRAEPSTSLAAKKQFAIGSALSARMKIPFRLPSGLTVVSTVASGHRTLAIDQAGALFLSEDSAGSWERVSRQWTGRAVTVRIRAAAPVSPRGALAAGQFGVNPANNGPAPSPAPIFEILNDKSQLWFSTDGRIWLPK